MLSMILSLALAAEPSTSMLILTTGRKLEVRSVEVKGRLAIVVDTSGDTLSIRADQIDQVNTDAANEQIEARRVADAEAADVAKINAEIERQRLEGLRERNRLASGTHRGGMSVAGGSAAQTIPDAAPQASGARAATSSGGGGNRLAAIRSRFKTAKAKAIRLTQECVTLADQGTKAESHAERVYLAGKLGTAERERDAAKAEMDSIRAEFAPAQEAVRKSGANASEWREDIE